MVAKWKLYLDASNEKRRISKGNVPQFNSLSITVSNDEVGNT